MKYHQRFGHLNADVCDATLELVKAKVWRRELEEQIGLAQSWAEIAAGAYGIPVPEVVIAADDMEAGLLTMMHGGGCYRETDNGMLILSKFSVVTLAHEFRHHWQRKTDGALFMGERGDYVYESDETIVIDRHDMRAGEVPVPAEEIDARAWSISLFAKVAPRRFRRMVEQGRVLFVDPRDVLDTA